MKKTNQKEKRHYGNFSSGLYGEEDTKTIRKEHEI